MMGLWAVALKELRQIRRDRRTLAILVFIPAFFLFLYGYALNFDIRHVSLAVEDRDGSAASRALVASFVGSDYFTLVASVTPGGDVNTPIDRREARAVLVIPPDFGARLAVGTPAEVQVILDGDNANTATTVMGYVTAILNSFTPPGATRDAAIAPVLFEPRIWYNPELRSTVFLVPGLIAFIAMITAVISTALSIVREKESGTMEQVRMAPIGMPAFVVGKTLPYLVLSQIGATGVIIAAMIFFDLPMRGSWLALSAVVALFLVGALGTGLFVSTVAGTQQVAFQAATLIAMLPTLILSGFIFPIASMPFALQQVTRVVPARYFLVALRGIVLKGLPLSALLAPIVALAVYAVVVLTLASLRLARR